MSVGARVSDSDGEAAETEVHLAFALRCGYLPPDMHTVLLDHYDHICRQIRKMMDDAASWCGPDCELREMPAEYFVGASERKSMEGLQHPHVEPQNVRHPPRSGRSSRSKRS